MSTTRHLLRRSLTTTALAALAALAAPAAFAQVTIDQAKVLAGNVTPGDAPGFPLTLSQPGSYKLTTNLLVPTGTAGVLITEPGVHLDLNGFTIASTNSCALQTSTSKVVCSEMTGAWAAHGVDGGSNGSTTIENGTVRGFQGNGVSAWEGSQLSRLTLLHNGGRGLWTRGGLASHIQARLNGDEGIVLQDAAVLEHASASTNGGDGISCYGGAVHRSTAVRNMRFGINNCAVRGTTTANNLLGNAQKLLSMGGNLAQGQPF